MYLLILFAIFWLYWFIKAEFIIGVTDKSIFDLGNIDTKYSIGLSFIVPFHIWRDRSNEPDYECVPGHVPRTGFDWRLKGWFLFYKNYETNYHRLVILGFVIFYRYKPYIYGEYTTVKIYKPGYIKQRLLDKIKALEHIDNIRILQKLVDSEIMPYLHTNHERSIKEFETFDNPSPQEIMDFKAGLLTDQDLSDLKQAIIDVFKNHPTNPAEINFD